MDYKNYNNYKVYMAAPESAANSMVCLINQTNELLDQKIRWTEEDEWLDNYMKDQGYKKLPSGQL